MELLHLSETDSTNTYLKTLAANGERRTVLLLADRQSGGRGRLGRSFFSPDGGLYMSLLFFPDMTPEEASLLTPLAALAVCAALGELFGVETQIKWVNDIYKDGKKLCGILAEAEPDKYAVIGIGLNIAEPSGGFPEDIADIAVALLPKGSDITALKEKLAIKIAELFLHYMENRRDARLLEEYRRRLLFVGERVFVNRFGEAYTATVLGINDDYGLCVRTESDETLVLHSGEISIRRAL